MGFISIIGIVLSFSSDAVEFVKAQQLQSKAYTFNYSTYLSSNLNPVALGNRVYYTYYDVDTSKLILNSVDTKV